MEIKFHSKKEMIDFIEAELNGPYVANKTTLILETSENKPASTIEFYGGIIL